MSQLSDTICERFNPPFYLAKAIECVCDAAFAAQVSDEPLSLSRLDDAANCVRRHIAYLGKLGGMVEHAAMPAVFSSCGRFEHEEWFDRLTSTHLEEPKFKGPIRTLSTSYRFAMPQDTAHVLVRCVQEIVGLRTFISTGHDAIVEPSPKSWRDGALAAQA